MVNKRDIHVAAPLPVVPSSPSSPCKHGSQQGSTTPPRKSTWLGTSWIMMADIVGTSVLTYAGVARQLGWVPTIALICLLCPIAVYTGVLMSRTRSLLVARAGGEPLTMGEAARLALGGDRAAAAVYATVYGFGFLGQASYLLVLGQTLQGVLFEQELCLPTAILYSCAVCVPFVVTVRHLAESIWLCFVNLLLILAVLGIVMAQLAHNGRPEGVRTFYFAEDLTAFTLFGAVTNILLSYTGHWLYFELMAEMREPEEFPRVFSINAPVQVSLYMLVACWGYYYAGDTAAGYFLDNLPIGLSYQLASLLLFAHVIVAFLIKNLVLARFLHGLLAPSRVSTRWSEPGGARAQAEHTCCALALLMASYLIANFVPFFMDFMGLIGGFLSGPISYILPMVFFAVAQRPRYSAAPEALAAEADRAPRLESGEHCAEDLPASDEHGQGQEAPGRPVLDAEAVRQSAPKQDGLSTPLLVGAAPEDRPCSAGAQASLGMTRLDKVLFVVVGLLTLMTMLIGTYDVLGRIIANLDRYGPPFSCKVLPRDRLR